MFLYFDLGNVLLHFSHERACRQMAAVASTPEREVTALFAAAGGLVLALGSLLSVAWFGRVI